MNYFRNMYHNRKPFRCLSAAVFITLLLTIPVASTLCSAATHPAEQPLFMFVHVAEDVQVDRGAQTIRLVDVNQQTLFFSDRPDRIAGHLKMDKYLDEWTPQAGPDNFSANPPNATLSVYESGKDENSLAVVEISNPVVDGEDLVYRYKLLEGDLPDSGGATSMFIDRIGIGGGVGVGYHGVGVGFRGPGFR